MNVPRFESGGYCPFVQVIAGLPRIRRRAADTGVDANKSVVAQRAPLPDNSGDQPWD